MVISKGAGNYDNVIADDFEEIRRMVKSGKPVPAYDAEWYKGYIYTYVPTLAAITNKNVFLLGSADILFTLFYSCLEEEYGIIIVYARERVECRLANMRESRHLGIPKGSAILYVERQTFGYRKSRPMELFPVEFVKMSYNAEKYTFHQIIRKE